MRKSISQANWSMASIGLRVGLLCILLNTPAFAFNPFATPQKDLFPLSIIHLNDFHARFEETNIQSKTCKAGESCCGGLARVSTAIKTLFEHRKNTHPIYLNAGDNFQGTLFYTLGRWDITQYFMNLIRPDAMTIGNHEFDNGIPGLVPFLERVKFPVVAANIDDSLEPTIQGKYFSSVVIDRYERKVGVIGVVNSHYNEFTNIGKLRLSDESESVRKEAAKLKSQGVHIVIVLSHCGIDVDKIIAEKGGPDISVIVGGHSHTFLYTGSNPPGPDKPEGEYPTVVENPAGHKVLIVQASALSKYVGDLTVWFNKDNKVVDWQGDPIFLGSDIPQDPMILNELKPWKEKMDQTGRRIVGHSDIKMERLGCNSHECELGNFITDVFVHHYETQQPKAADEWTSSSIAIVNTGGLRTTIEEGDVTYADLISTIPFENSVDLIDLRGEHLLEALEYSVSSTWTPPEFTSINMLQVSGIRATFNVTEPIGHRLKSAEVLCNKCQTPKYEPVHKDKFYPIITISFLVRGGDGYKSISENYKNRRYGPVDNDIVLSYFKTVKTYKPASNEPRLKIVT